MTDQKISVMVVNIDYYLSKLDVQADLDTIHQIAKQTPISCPVIRIFGSTPLGQRACLHVHGVLPYLYFRPENYLHAAFDTLQKIVRLLPVLEKCLEELLHMRRQRVMQSLQINQGEENQNNTTYVKKRKHINRLEIVKKKSIYGMMSEDIFFVKVYLHDPGDKKRLAEILEEGALAGISMQTFEAHIPYLLQFTSDCNISPMGWIHLNKIKFRPPLPSFLNESVMRSNSPPQNLPLDDSTLNGAQAGSQHSIYTPSQSNLKNAALNESSPIFKFLSANACSVSSPLPNNHLASSTTPLKQELSPQSALSHGYYTQQTVSEEQLWRFQQQEKEKETLPHPTISERNNTETTNNKLAAAPSISYNLDENDQVEVAKLLDGLTEGDLVWSQCNVETYLLAKPKPLVNYLSLGNIPHAQIASAPQPRHKRSIITMEKDSTCELELDSHSLHIANQSMGKAEFGAELWEEERMRCSKLGIMMEDPLELPSSQRMQKVLQRKEVEYYERLHSLQEKGKALRRNTKSALLKSRIEQSKKQVLPTEVLSQFLTAHDQQEVEDSLPLVDTLLIPSPPSDSLLSEYEDWAKETIQNTAQVAAMQDEMVRELVGESKIDPVETLVEDYAKSQVLSQQQAVLTRDQEDRRDIDEDDDEHSAASIQRETLAILSSTQLEDSSIADKGKNDIPNHSERSNLPNVAVDSPIITVPFSSDKAKDNRVIQRHAVTESPAIFRLDLDNNADDFAWSYSTPSPLPQFPTMSDPILSKAKGVNITSMKKSDIREGNILESSFPGLLPENDGNANAMYPNNSKPPLPPGRRRMSGDGNAVNLVSALAGKRSRSPFARQTPPSTTASSILESDMVSKCMTDGIKDESAQKKVKRSVSFAPPKQEMNNANGETISAVLVSAPASSGAKADEPPFNKEEIMTNYLPSTESSGRIHIYTIKPSPPSESSYAQKNRKMLLQSIQLQPSFQPPCGKHLPKLQDLGLDTVMNIRAHFSNFDDADKEKKQLLAAQGGTSYASYQSLLHRFIPYKHDLPPFDGGVEGSYFNPNARRITNRKRCLLPTFMPPRFMDKEKLPAEKAENKNDSSLAPGTSPPTSWLKSQIATPTQTPGSSLNSNLEKHEIGCGRTVSDTVDSMTRLIALSMELFCCTRKDLLANPKSDPITFIVWIADDMLRNASTEYLHRFGGIICVAESPDYIDAEGLEKKKHNLRSHLRTSNIPDDTMIDIVSSEVILFEKFITVVQDIDPDFLLGYENLAQSYGYLIKRGVVLGIPCLERLSRLPKEKPSFRNTLIATNQGCNIGADEEEGALDAGNIGIYIKGRTFLNNWQVMASEVKLADACIQKVVEVILKQSLPYYSARQLTQWFRSHSKSHYAVSYVYTLALANLLLLEKLDYFRKVSECSRLYGIDFYSVMHRGSQYRVEAALLLRAHAQGYLLLSPSRNKVANQAPMEVIPLVLEPKSQFYTDPVVVLDFQSLYPSIIIAFNLCFSTIIGKLRTGKSKPDSDQKSVTGLEQETTGRIGVLTYPESLSASLSTLHMTSGQLQSPNSSNLINKVEDMLNMAKNGSEGSDEGELHEINYDNVVPYMSPNGSVFISPAVRKGTLPMMLQEMLDTRVMIKTAMKRYAGREDSKNYRVLQKVLDARQLAIKLLSNVTYGYTAAGFSGRMPMAELADAIVQTGRSLLEHTIRTINSHPQWRARVVYGDTDSVFVLLPGRSLGDAFRIGEEISAHVTSHTPKHIILKFEKVYYPSLLVTKKRYVGQCYENKKNLNDCHLDAKGIEMIRKDQCQATMKIQEKAIRLLFQTRDLSLVKSYLTAQWTKLLQDHYKLLLQDFIFYKEVRFGYYNSIASQPPGAIVATKAVLVDEMAVPPYNWRVPYLVVYGPPNTPLKHLVYDPIEVLRRGSNLRCNFLYYITKCINPALDRVLSLCGVNVFAWFQGMQRPKVRVRHVNYDNYQEEGKSATRVGLLLGNFASNQKKGVQMLMDQFTTQALCEVCQERDAMPRKLLCSNCLSPDQMSDSYHFLIDRYRQALIENETKQDICRKCASYNASSSTHLFAKNEMIGKEACESLACTVFHERWRGTLRLEDYHLAVKDMESCLQDLLLQF